MSKSHQFEELQLEARMQQLSVKEEKEGHLSPGDIVWYEHDNKRMYPALTLQQAFLPPNLREYERFRGKKAWLGLTIGLPPDPATKKGYVILCPKGGNAIRDHEISRVILQIDGGLPNDDNKVEEIINNFKSMIENDPSARRLYENAKPRN